MAHIDKNGHHFEVKVCAPEDFSLLVEMYELFTPKASFQGMPPLKKNVRDTWLQQLVANGVNLLAWYHGMVVGHAALLYDLDKKDAEYLIFISQTYRGLGVGMALTRTAIEKAEALGLKTVWLTVDAYNFRALRLYQKAGFKCHHGYSAVAERMMVLSL